MTVHRKMFDVPDEEEPTMHRVYVEWPGGYFVTFGSHDSRFQEMVKELGRPSNIEFRATNEGWIKD